MWTLRNLAYGPNVYFLTRYVGRLRAAVAAADAAGDFAVSEKLFSQCAADVANEVKKMTAFLFVINVKKSPFFVDAEEDRYMIDCNYCFVCVS